MLNLKTLLILCVSIVLLIIFVFIVNKTYQNSRPISSTQNTLKNNRQAIIKINSLEISAEIADTPDARRQGLSDREMMPERGGMLFIFDPKQKPHFWMYHMNFPLDLIWISDNKIVDISKNVPNPLPDTPNSQLPIYTPSEPINYVLEINAGISDKNVIKIGDTVDIKY